MAEPAGEALSVRQFQLDVRERRLSHGCNVKPSVLKAFDTLGVLVENAGRLITEQELRDTASPEATMKKTT